MYKNIICFFIFLFITKNLQVAGVRRVEDSWAEHTGANSRNIQWTPFPFSLVGSKCSWLYNIPGRICKFSRSHLQPAVYTRLLLACYQRNLRSISYRNICILLKLSTRCISCYSHSMYPISTDASTNIKRGLQVNIQQGILGKNQSFFLMLFFFVFSRTYGKFWDHDFKLIWYSLYLCRCLFACSLEE